MNTSTRKPDGDLEKNKKHVVQLAVPVVEQITLDDSIELSPKAPQPLDTKVEKVLSPPNSPNANAVSVSTPSKLTPPLPLSTSDKKEAPPLPSSKKPKLTSEVTSSQYKVAVGPTVSSTEITRPLPDQRKLAETSERRRTRSFSDNRTSSKNASPILDKNNTPSPKLSSKKERTSTADDDEDDSVSLTSKKESPPSPRKEIAFETAETKVTGAPSEKGSVETNVRFSAEKKRTQSLSDKYERSRNIVSPAVTKSNSSSLKSSNKDPTPASEQMVKSTATTTKEPLATSNKELVSNVSETKVMPVIPEKTEATPLTEKKTSLPEETKRTRTPSDQKVDSNIVAKNEATLKEIALSLEKTEVTSSTEKKYAPPVLESETAALSKKKETLTIPDKRTGNVSAPEKSETVEKKDSSSIKKEIPSASSNQKLQLPPVKEPQPSSEKKEILPSTPLMTSGSMTAKETSQTPQTAPTPETLATLENKAAEAEAVESNPNNPQETTIDSKSPERKPPQHTVSNENEVVPADEKRIESAGAGTNGTQHASEEQHLQPVVKDASRTDTNTKAEEDINLAKKEKRVKQSEPVVSASVATTPSKGDVQKEPTGKTSVPTPEDKLEPPPQSRKPNRVEIQQKQVTADDRTTTANSPRTETETPSTANEDKIDNSRRNASFPNIVVTPPAATRKPPPSKVPPATPVGRSSSALRLDSDIVESNPSAANSTSASSSPTVKVTDVLDRRLGTAPILGGVCFSVNNGAIPPGTFLVTTVSNCWFLAAATIYRTTTPTCPTKRVDAVTSEICGRNPETAIDKLCPFAECR
jgi:hypothetical protein